MQEYPDSDEITEKRENGEITFHKQQSFCNFHEKGQFTADNYVINQITFNGENSHFMVHKKKGVSHGHKNPLPPS